MIMSNKYYVAIQLSCLFTIYKQTGQWTFIVFPGYQKKDKRYIFYDIYFYHQVLLF